MYKYKLEMYQSDMRALVKKIKHMHADKLPYDFIYGIPQGGTIPATNLSQALNIPLITQIDGIDPKLILIVDDLVDSGNTLAKFKDYDCAVIGCKPDNKYNHEKLFFIRNFQNEWIHFWWEPDPESGVGSIHDNVIRILEYIGEDMTREGLIETPKRIVKSWGKLFQGYGQNPKDVMKIFEDGACDEMVLLKDIELYSMCEHHMLPFFGKCHIAYIPNHKVIGISKLARLMEIYARRMQIQERIGDQITDALMMHLEPLGAACIIEAQHFCMKARGIEKQNSIMVTSSLKGIFKGEPATRAEFMRLIR